jgi:hypothetical protein
MADYDQAAWDSHSAARGIRPWKTKARSLPGLRRDARLRRSAVQSVASAALNVALGRIAWASSARSGW